MKIQFLESDDIARELEFSEGLIRIGWHESCNLCLPDLRLAPQHITLFRQPEGGWVVEATSAGATTYHNGKHLAGSAPVHNSDELMVLEYRMRMLIPKEETGAVPVEMGRVSAATSTSASAEEVARIRQFPMPPGAVVRKLDEDSILSAPHRQLVADVAFRIRTCDTLPKLMDLVLNTLLHAFQGHLAWFGVRRNDFGRLENVEGRLFSGKSGGDPAIVETVIYRCLERGQLLSAPTPDNRETGPFLAAPVVTHRGRVGVVYVESKPDLPSYDLRQVGLLTCLMPLFGGQLELVFTDQAKLLDAVAAGEQSFLRQIQSRLDLVNVPQWDGYQIAAYCKAGLDRVGDVYDMMRLPNGMIALMIGHAVGEPARVAMAITEIRAAFRVAGLHADPPHTVLKVFDWLMHDERHPCQLACAAIIVNPKTGVNQYATAGSIGVAVIDAAGEPRRLVDAAVPAAGTARGQTYASKIGQLRAGESLVLYSPGILGVCDSSGEALGEKRFLGALGDSFGQPAAAAIEEVTSEYARFFKQGRNPDDITLLVLRRTD